MLGRLLSVLLVAAMLVPAAAQAAGPQATKAALDRQMRWAGKASGALVIDLDTGKRIYARRPDTARVPASVNKLFTTAAALIRLGPEATLNTQVLVDGTIDLDGVLRGNLYLRGAGDPTLDTGKLLTLANRLASEAGIFEVDGRVIGDESAFDGLRGPPSSRWRTSGYVGPLSALSLDQGRTGVRAPHWQATPPLFAAQAFARALKRAGIKASVRAARTGATPPQAAALLTLPSPTMAELARLANVPSDNFVAEQLIKAIAAASRPPGTTAGGARLVRATMAGLGLRPRVADGSGLSRSNRTTPRQVVRLLTEMDAHPVADAFANSLAVAGRTGTLSKRMRRSPARDRCSGKTGTLISVSALAGYCETAGGSRIAYAFLMNGVSPYGARALQDRMLGALASYAPSG